MSLIHSRTPKNEAECGRCGTTTATQDLRRCTTCKRQICYDCRGSEGDAISTTYFCNTDDSDCGPTI